MGSIFILIGETSRCDKEIKVQEQYGNNDSKQTTEQNTEKKGRHESAMMLLCMKVIIVS